MSITIGFDKENNKIKVYKSLSRKNKKWLAVKEDTHNLDSNTELCYRPFETKEEAIREAKFILLQDYITNAEEIEKLLDNPYIIIDFDFVKHYGDYNSNNVLSKY